MPDDILQDKRPAPLISALMVTQAGREALARLAMIDFIRQNHPNRELVVVHDGGLPDQDRLSEISNNLNPDLVRIIQADPDQTLGTLRNIAVQAARGDVVCQWDDDDRYHPERLALQWTALRDSQNDVCFLCDQLHLFAKTGELYWDDWTREAYPFDVVQGTIMARKACLPAYSELARGEDTQLLVDLLKSGAAISRVKGAGWCYVYVHHAQNAWSESHHRAISRAKAIGAVSLLQRRRLLKERLAEYQPPLGPLRLSAPGAVSI